MIKTEDGKEFDPKDCKLVGSVKRFRSREVSKPAKIGEFPVFVEQSGSYRVFTYSKKLVEL